MKKLKSILILVSSFSLLFPQVEKSLTKLDKFISNTGQIVKVENFYLTNLVGSSEKLKSRIKRVTISSGDAYFLTLIKEDKYNDKSASIAEVDLKELIRALNILIEQSKNENTIADYYENKFTTDDGFQIGYGGGVDYTAWFITLESYGDAMVVFRDVEPLLEAFNFALQRIEEIKQRD